jgi:hypothetical protein
VDVQVGGPRLARARLAHSAGVRVHGPHTWRAGAESRPQLLTSGGLPRPSRQSDLSEDQIELEQTRLNVQLLDTDVEIFLSFQIEPAPVRPSLRAGWASTLCC